MLRQFHVEGFVNQFRLDSISPDGITIVFIMEAKENLPPGWRAKETYHILSNDDIEETFLLAETGLDFTLYLKVKL